MHLLFVVVRSANHGGVVAELGGVLGETKSFDGGLDAGAGDHHFVGRGGGDGGFEDVAAFLVGEQNGFSGGTLHYDAGDRGARIALDIRLQLFVVDGAVGVEGRGDGREDSG